MTDEITVQEISRDIQVGSRYFHLHSEPSMAQKNAWAKFHDDDNVPGPWPWWANSDDVSSTEFNGGPYESAEEAQWACLAWVKAGNN